MFPVKEEYYRAIRTRYSRTITGFFAGLFVGALVGLNCLTGIISGIVTALLIWCFYSIEVEEREKIHHLKNGDKR